MNVEREVTWNHMSFQYSKQYERTWQLQAFTKNMELVKSSGASMLGVRSRYQWILQGLSSVFHCWKPWIILIVACNNMNYKTGFLQPIRESLPCHVQWTFTFCVLNSSDGNFVVRVITYFFACSHPHGKLSNAKVIQWHWIAAFLAM